MVSDSSFPRPSAGEKRHISLVVRDAENCRLLLTLLSEWDMGFDLVKDGLLNGW